MRRFAGANDVLKMVTGTAVAQIIGFAFIPLLTRIFPPEAFGTLGVFMALLTFLTPLATLSLPLAIVTSKTDSEARITCSLAFVLAVAICFILFLLLLFLYPSFENRFGNGLSYQFMLLLPIALLFCAFFEIADNWCIRAERYAFRAKAAVLQATMANVTKVILSLLFTGATPLVFVAALNPLIFVLLMILAKAEKNFFNLFDFSSLKARRKILTDQKDLVFFHTPQLLLNGASLSGIVLIIANSFGPVMAGYYALARTVLILPVSLIGKAVGDVFYKTTSTLYQTGQKSQIWSRLVAATMALAALGIVPLVIIWLWGPVLFQFVFGQQWREAGELAGIISVWLFFVLINAPSLKVMIVFKKLKWPFLMNCISTPARLLSMLAVASYTNSLELSVWAFVIVSALHNCILVLLAIYLCIIPDTPDLSR